MVTELSASKYPAMNIVKELFPAGYELLPGVNQIYELDFALSEYRSLKKDELVRRSAFLKLVDGKETFHYRMCKDTMLEVDKSASYRLKSFMQVYQFKTAYATHGLFPYRGKFHPQMIKAIINLMGVKENGTILDPMMGSGTTNIEASIMGINNIGIDVSPFCVLMVKAKVEGLSLSPEPLKKCLALADQIFDYFQASSDPLFNSNSADLPKRLSFLEDKSYQEYLKLCYLDTLGYAARRKKKEAKELFPTLLSKYISVLKAFSHARNDLKLKVGRTKVVQGDARNLRTPLRIEDNSIDGIITSPPYSFAIDYLKGDKAQLNFMGVNTEAIRDRMIGLRGDKKNQGDLVAKYLIDMKVVMSEMQRVLKSDSYSVIVIGTNATQLQKISEFIDGKMKLEDELVRIGRDVGLSLVQRISRPIEGIRNSIRNEEILFFRK